LRRWQVSGIRRHKLDRYLVVTTTKVEHIRSVESEVGIRQFLATPRSADVLVSEPAIHDAAEVTKIIEKK